VHVRDKNPAGSSGTEAVFPAGADTYTTGPSADFRFASAVAEFGLVASGSRNADGASPARARERAEAALGEDPYGLRSEFVSLVDAYEEIAG